MKKQISGKILDKILEQIEACNLPEEYGRWLLGVSGGCDSMALMEAVVGLSEAYPKKFRYLHVAHLNHQLRGQDSDADADFVAEQAKRLNLPVTVGSIDVAAAAQAAGESIETAARRRRFGFLAETARKLKCQIIAQGHNADDQAETILHRIIRGTGIRGLAGIPPVRQFYNDGGEPFWLVRPLLSVRRIQIEQFLRQQGLAWRQDASNLSVQFTRNRIRHDLLPHLADKYNPRVVEALLQLGQTAQWVRAILNEDAAEDLADMTLRRSDDSIALDAARLMDQPRIKKAEIIHQALLTLNVPQKQIGFRHIAAALELLNGAKPADRVLQLPYSAILKRQGNHLIIETAMSVSEEAPDPPSAEIILLIPGKTALPKGFLWIDPTTSQAEPAREIVTELISATHNYLDDFRREKTSRQEIFDHDKLHGPLRLRCRRDGDRFGPLGGPGPKKLGDFFTDTKIPIPLRNRLGLICDDRGVLWILGLRISDHAKITRQTTYITKITVK